MHAVIAGHAVGPFIGNGEAVNAGNLITGAAGIIRPDFEAGGEDNAIDLIGHAIKHDGILRHALDTASVRINQLHIGAVKGGEIIIVKTRPLAEQTIIRFQRIGCVRVFHHIIHAVANTLHFMVIGNFHRLRDIHETHGFVGQIFFHALAIKARIEQGGQSPKSDARARRGAVAQSPDQQFEGIGPAIRY